MKGRKAQSAMEYLMTYGWAILIIAIVLAALFSLGVFSSSSFLGTTCISLSGYTCSSPLLHGGAVTATVGQATGTSWSSALFFFLPSGTTLPVNTIAYTPNTACVFGVTGGLNTGGTVTFTVNAPIATYNTCGSNFLIAVGTTASGQIWAQYQTTSTGSANLMAQIATVTLKES